jgi:acyl-CoA dehydrogenase
MDLTPEQKDIVKAAREFAEGEFRDRAKEFDEREEFDLDIWRRSAANGFQATFLEEEYGGAGLGFLEHSLITEQFWRVDPGCGQSLCAASFGSEMIQAFGTEAQKRRYLTPIPKGEAIIAFAITEPDAGSDVTLVRTRAEKKGDKYVINGTKMFISNGNIASYVLVYALTHPEEKDVHKRHSIILMETSSPGYEAIKIHGKMGIRAANTAELTLTNVEAPA